jgi:hypothetical protein
MKYEPLELKDQHVFATDTFLSNCKVTLQNDYEVVAAASLQTKDAIMHAGPDVFDVFERVALLVKHRRRRNLLFQTTAWTFAAYACATFAYYAKLYK